MDYFIAKTLKKGKLKKTTAMNILDELLVKNAIYLCSLVPSMGDNLHTITIVIDWIFV